MDIFAEKKMNLNSSSTQGCSAVLFLVWVLVFGVFFFCVFFFPKEDGQSSVFNLSGSEIS